MFVFILSAFIVIALHSTAKKNRNKQWWSWFSASTVSPEDCSYFYFYCYHQYYKFHTQPQDQEEEPQGAGQEEEELLYSWWCCGGAMMITPINQTNCLHSPCCSRKTNKNKDECPSVCQCKCHCLHLVRIYNRCEWCTTSIASLPCLSTMKLLTR